MFQKDGRDGKSRNVRGAEKNVGNVRSRKGIRKKTLQQSSVRSVRWKFPKMRSRKDILRRGAGHMGESHEGARERKGVLSDTAGGAGKQDGCCLPADQGSGDGRKTGDGRQRRRDEERNQHGGVLENDKGG